MLEFMRAINGTQHSSTGYTVSIQGLYSPSIVGDRTAGDVVIEGTSPSVWAEHMRELQRIAEPKLASANGSEKAADTLQSSSTCWSVPGTAPGAKKEFRPLIRPGEIVAVKLAHKLEGSYPELSAPLCMSCRT